MMNSDTNKTIKQNGLAFTINEEEKTADLINLYHPIEKVFIPRSIKHNSEEFIIKRITSHSFCSNYLTSIEFESDSSVQVIEKDVFVFSNLESITIPPSVCELADGWCQSTAKLTQVTIMPNNKRYKNYEGNIVIGKSDIENDEFDVLVFVGRNTKSFIIPPFITKISPHAFSKSQIENLYIPPQITAIGENAFDNCTQLKKVEFSENSKLRVIEDLTFRMTSIESIYIPSNIVSINGQAFSCCKQLRLIDFSSDSKLKTISKNAFFETAIQSITVPPNVSELQEGWCSGTSHLNNVRIVPNNKRYKNYDDKIIIGKSDINSDEYDTLIFAQRDAKTVQIPQFIKVVSSFSFANSIIESVFIPASVNYIGECAFHSCKNLLKVEIHPDSKIQSIEANTFYYSGIESFYFPSQISKISFCVFFNCRNLHSIGFSQESNLQEIGPNSFNNTSIVSLCIPPKVTDISYSSFIGSNIKLIEIDEHFNMQKLDKNIFNILKNSIIMFPVKFIDYFVDK